MISSKEALEVARKNLASNKEFILQGHDLIEVEDPAINPSHYKNNGMETIEILEAMLTSEQLEGFLLGNIIKYSSRFRQKNGVQDLKKARWYLDRLIDNLEREQD